MIIEASFVFIELKTVRAGNTQRSVAGCVPSMLQALGSIPDTRRKTPVPGREHLLDKNVLEEWMRCSVCETQSINTADMHAKYHGNKRNHREMSGWKPQSCGSALLVNRNAVVYSAKFWSTKNCSKGSGPLRLQQSWKFLLRVTHSRPGAEG